MISSTPVVRTLSNLASSVAPAARQASPLRQRVNQLGQATSHYGNILFQHEKQIKYLTAIVASFLLVLSRIFTAWKTAVRAQDKHSKQFSTKEAYRTTLRELGGFTFSYALLKVIEKKYTERLQKKVGLLGKGAPPKKSNALPSSGSAFRGWIGDVRRIFNGTADPSQWKTNKIYRTSTQPPLEAGNYTTFAKKYQTSPAYRGWVNLFQKKVWQGGFKPSLLKANFLQQGHSPVELFRPLLKNAPMAVGGATALVLSGFFLEWLTINKMDTITHWLSGGKKSDLESGVTLPSSRFSPASSNLSLRNDTGTDAMQPNVLTSWDVYDQFTRPFTT